MALKPDLQASVLKLQASVNSTATRLHTMDPRALGFLERHAQLGGSLAAAALLEQLKAMGPSPRKASAVKDVAGPYGAPLKTARLCLLACAELELTAGQLGVGARFRNKASAEDMRLAFGQNPSSTAMLILASSLIAKQELPEELKEHQFTSEDNPKKEAGELPEELEKHQFTSEDNPNPKGNDKDKDGDTGEEKPFKEASARELHALRQASVPTTVRGWLEWEPS